MTKFSKSMSKEELMEIAKNAGMEVDDTMKKDEIYDNLKAFMEDEPVDEEGSPETDPLKQEDPKPQSEKQEDGKPEKPQEEKSESDYKAKAVKRFSGFKRYAYAGPTIKGTKLRENAVFAGSLEDVMAYLGDELKEYPEAAELLVPTEKLAEYKQKKEKRGNSIHNTYKSIASASARNGKKRGG